MKRGERMSYLTDDEHRILLAALRKEKEFCSRQLTSSKECVKIVQSLERKFYYDRFEKEIRDKAIDTFSDKLKEKCDSMIAEKWNNEVAPISWANAYADFKDDVDEIAEQMKEAGE